MNKVPVVPFSVLKMVVIMVVYFFSISDEKRLKDDYEIQAWYKVLSTPANHGGAGFQVSFLIFKLMCVTLCQETLI